MTQATNHQENILQVVDLKKYYPIVRGLNRQVVGNLRAVDGVSFSIQKNETLGLVGESGCGKTTVAKCVMRALHPTDGHIFLNVGEEMVDISQLSESQLRPLRRNFQMVFQDPYKSINPRVMVRYVIGESLNAFKYERKFIDERVEELLSLVGLSPDMAGRYPYAFSGGQRQRIAIARALAMQPKLLVLDEPVSSLDVSVQSQILNLLKQIQLDMGLAYLFISHDLSVVRYMSDKIAVMYLGKLVEYGASDTIFKHHQHPYTEMLLASLPDADPDSNWSVNKVKGEAESIDPAAVVVGCIFSKRCSYAQPLCLSDTPALRNNGEMHREPHFVACHFPLSI